MMVVVTPTLMTEIYSMTTPKALHKKIKINRMSKCQMMKSRSLHPTLISLPMKGLKL
jgi:hypothetical protein